MTSEPPAEKPTPNVPVTTGRAADPPPESTREIIQRIENLPPEEREDVYAELSLHVGPLPPPAQLEEYQRILPNGAERIMQMAEREQAHRMEMDREALDHEKSASKRGQIIGGAATILAVVGAVIVAMLGADWKVVAAIVGLPLATMVVTIVTGRRSEKLSQAEERKEDVSIPR